MVLQGCHRSHHHGAIEGATKALSKAPRGSHRRCRKGAIEGAYPQMTCPPPWGDGTRARTRASTEAGAVMRAGAPAHRVGMMRRMDERSGVDPQVVAELWERESERYAREHPRCLRTPRERPLAHASRRADELDGELLRPPAGVDRRGARRPLHLRRRRPVPRHQRGRQEHVLRHRPGAGGAGRTGARRQRLPVHAAHRGRDRRRRPARAALGPARTGSSRCRRRRPTPRRSGWPGTRPAGRKVLTFTGNYGGHGDEMLAALAGEGRLSYLGLAPGAGDGIQVVPFNDAERAGRGAGEPRVRLRLHGAGPDQRGRRPARAGVPRRAPATSRARPARCSCWTRPTR